MEDEENNVLRVRPMDALYSTHSAGPSQPPVAVPKVKDNAAEKVKETTTKLQRSGPSRSKLQSTPSASAKPAMMTKVLKTRSEVKESKGQQNPGRLRTAKALSLRKEAMTHVQPSERRISEENLPGMSENVGHAAAVAVQSQSQHIPDEALVTPPTRTSEEVRRELERMLRELPPSDQAIFLEGKTKVNVL